MWEMLVKGAVNAFATSAAKVGGQLVAHELFGPDPKPSPSPQQQATPAGVSPDAKYKSPLEDIGYDYPKGDGFVGRLVSKPPPPSVEINKNLIAGLYQSVLSSPLPTPALSGEISKIAQAAGISSRGRQAKSLKKMIT